MKIVVIDEASLYSSVWHVKCRLLPKDLIPSPTTAVALQFHVRDVNFCLMLKYFLAHTSSADSHL